MLDPLTSPLIAGVLGDTLAIVFVHLVAHQVLQIALSSHIPSRWYVPYESDDPYGLPEQLGLVQAALAGREDGSGAVQLGMSGTENAWKPADEVGVLKGHSGGEQGEQGDLTVRRDEVEQVRADAPLERIRGVRGLRERMLHPAAVEACVLVLLWPVIQVLLWAVGPGKPEHVVADLVLGSVSFVYVCFGFSTATSIAFPDPVAFALRRPRATLEYTIREVDHTPPRLRRRMNRVRHLAAYAAALAMFVSSYYGVALLQALVPGLAVYSALRNFRPKELHVKQMALSLIGAVAFCGAVGIFFYWKDGPGSPTDTDGKTMPVSPWIASTFGMGLFALGNVAQPAVIILLNLRFEHSPVHTPARMSRQPVLIRPNPPFRGFIFHTSLVALLLSLWGTHVVGGTFHAWLFVPDGMGMMFLGWFVTVPAVVGASWAAARWRGVEREWWAYHELWMPSFGQVKEMDGE